MSIRESAVTLKLPFIKNNYEECIREAYLNDWDHEQFLDALLKNEIEMRKQNAVKTKIRELETLEFVDNDENIILIGNPGTGKTALAVALGMKACLMNRSVLFVNVSNLLIELKEAMNLNQISRYKKRFKKYDLVILDELGYCSFDKERGEILFNLLSSRNEKKATIITSNLTFDRWNEIFNDSVLAGAMIDRMAYKSHLINMTGDSYRIMATKEWNEKHKSSYK